MSLHMPSSCCVKIQYKIVNRIEEKEEKEEEEEEEEEKHRLSCLPKGRQHFDDLIEKLLVETDVRHFNCVTWRPIDSAAKAADGHYTTDCLLTYLRIFINHFFKSFLNQSIASSC